MSREHDGLRPRVLMVGLGGPTFITDWARAVERFAEVAAVTAVSELPPASKSIGRGIALGSVEEFDTVFVKWRKLRPSRYFWRINARLEARALLRGLKADGSGARGFEVVHSHFYSMALPVSYVARSISAHHLHTEHSSNLIATDPAMGPSRAGLRMLARALRSVSELFVVSESLAEALTRFGVSRHLHVVPNPVDDTLFWPRSDAPPDEEGVRLITVGSLIERKNHQALLEAFARLTGLVSKPLHLTLVGDGKLRSDLEAVADGLGVGEFVDFRGWLSRAEIAALLRSSHIYVHTSRAETFGVAIAEAMMSGLPVVVRRAGGLTDEIRPGEGITVADTGFAEIAEKLSHLITKLDAYDRQWIAACASSRFSISSVSKTISGVYAPYLGLGPHAD